VCTQANPWPSLGNSVTIAQGKILLGEPNTAKLGTDMGVVKFGFFWAGDYQKSNNTWKLQPYEIMSNVDKGWCLESNSFLQRLLARTYKNYIMEKKKMNTESLLSSYVSGQQLPLTISLENINHWHE
jgi:hypothetical protein